MNQGIIYYDRAGVLRKGLVWIIEVPFADARDITWANTDGGASEDIRGCKIDGSHVTNLKEIRIELEVYGREKVADFIPVSDMPYLIVSSSFAETLKKSGLSGFQCRPNVKITSQEPAVRNLKLFYLEITGKGGFDRRKKVKGAPNLCPHCAKVVMVCPECGDFNWPKCRSCDKLTLFRPDAPDYSHPDGFRFDKDYPKEYSPIIEAKDWEGSDFFRQGGSPFVSTRAKEWMEKSRTFPVRFKPALLNIEGVEDKFKVK